MKTFSFAGFSYLSGPLHISAVVLTAAMEFLAAENL